MTSSLLPFFPFLLSLVLLPFNIVAKNEECLAVLDVVQIQDVTRTLDRFLPTMKSQVGRVMKKIADTNPEAKFGLASFQDKKITGLSPTTRQPHMLGNKTDYCVRLDAKLSKPNTRNIMKAFQKYEARKDGGGGDTKEGNFEALYRVLLTPKAGWRLKTAKGREVAKLAVIVTNGVSHLAGDVRALTGKKVRPFELTLEGLEKHNYNVNYDCDKVDYPEIEQVVELVKQNKAQVVVLAAPCGKFDSKGQFTACHDLAALGDEYKKPDGLVHWYRKQFHDANLNALVYELDSEMENYAEVFSKAIDDVVESNHEAIRRQQHNIEKLQGVLKKLPEILSVETHEKVEKLELRELVEELRDFRDFESALEQVLKVIPEKCLSEKERREFHQQTVDGLDITKSFLRRIEMILASKENKRKEQQDKLT